MQTTFNLVPRGMKLIKLSLFYWVAYTSSAMVFAILATFLSIAGLSMVVTLFMSLVLATAYLVSVYAIGLPIGERSSKVRRTMRGNLSDVSVIMVFNLIRLAGKTGALVVKGANETLEFSFLAGRLVKAQIQNQDSSLMAIIQESSKLSDEQVRMLRQQAGSATDKVLSQLIVKNGYLRQEELSQVVRLYYLTKVFAAISWVAGTFHFEPDRIPPDIDTTWSIDPEEIIWESPLQTRRQILESLAHHERELQRISERERIAKAKTNLDLAIEQWAILSFIKTNTLPAIVSAFGLSPVEVQTFVSDLLRQGTLELVPKKSDTDRPSH